MADLIPSPIPGIQVATLASSENTAYVTNDSDIGPATYQLKTLNIPTIWDVQWKLSPYQYQIFEGWYANILSKGVISFLVDLPVGAGDVEHECNFVGSYTSSRIGRIWVVTAQLRVIEKVYNDQDLFDDLLALEDLFSGFFIENAVNGLILFGFVTLPLNWQNIEYGTDHS